VAGNEVVDSGTQGVVTPAIDAVPSQVATTLEVSPAEENDNIVEIG
jgi:hypothetical protein